MQKSQPSKTRLRNKVAAGAVGATILAMAFIAPWEGYSPAAYQDSANIWTICRGHTQGVKKGMTATLEQCEEFFETDVGKAIRQVNSAVKVPISAPEMAAYTSIVFNVGIGKFKTSTMLKKVNAGDRKGACNEFMRWVYVGGKDCRIRANRCYGIVRRRIAERNLCLTELR